MPNFESTETYSAEVIAIAVTMSGVVTMTVRNIDSLGNIIGTVTITAPNSEEENATHQKTGNTGVLVPVDMVTAASTLVAKASDLLALVIANGKHAL